jgi:transposase
MAPWWYGDEETIRPWGQAFHEAGLHGLERAPIPGHPTCLTVEQQGQVTEAVRRGPRESGSHASLWTTTWVRHFMSTRLGSESCRERVRQLRHEWGSRRRGLRHLHLQAKPEEPAAFRTELEARLAEGPADWEWLLVDKATVRRHPTLTAPWCLGDEGPEVPTGGDHTTVQVDGAVAPLTGRTHDHLSAELGKGECAPFLQHLSVYYPRKRLLVIHDRGEPQKGAPVAAILREAGAGSY